MASISLHDLVVHARRAEAEDALTGLGVRHVTELAEAAAGVDVLLLCVFSDAQLAEIAGPLAAALAVKLVNNFLFAANTQLAAEAVRLGEAHSGCLPGSC